MVDKGAKELIGVYKSLRHPYPLGHLPEVLTMKHARFAVAAVAIAILGCSSDSSEGGAAGAGAASGSGGAADASSEASVGGAGGSADASSEASVGGAGGSAGAGGTAGAGVDASCNQPGASACSAVIEAWCDRGVQCTVWADVLTCKADAMKQGYDCSASKIAEAQSCVDKTQACVGDLPLVACSDMKGGTANWPASCSTFWAQF